MLFRVAISQLPLCLIYSTPSLSLSESIDNRRFLREKEGGEKDGRGGGGGDCNDSF